MQASRKSPPAFSWQAWYDGLGGRAINVPARDFEGFPTKKFPEVIFEEVPPPYDGVSKNEKHIYGKLKR